MPDTLMTTGVSLGLLAGIVSGVCYVIANGINWPRSEDRKRCLPPSDEGICRRCGGDCHGGALPCVCAADTPRTKFRKGGWFLQQLQRAGALMPWSLTTEKLEQIDEECEGSASPEGGVGDLRSVREFLEALSAKLAGGPLEGTRVAPLYQHPAYESMFDRHHATMRDALASLANALRDALIHLPNGESASSATSVAPSNASSAHAQLKRLVARVVEEAAALPALARYAAEPPRSPSVEASTYEDLLATAILNKVIERYQTENGSGGRSSGIHSVSASPTPSERSSPRSLHLRHPRDITPPLLEDDEEDASDWEGGVDDLELPRRVPFPEYGGDIIHAGDNGDQFFDDASSSDIQANDGSWEENWLFQKKKIKTLQSVPVPMLVPNSNAEYRAMIGDRDADDTTDLSDNASDAEEEQTEFKSDVKRILDSKHVIGGKTKVEEQLDFEPDSLTMLDGVAEFDEEDLDDDNKVNDAVNGDVGGRMNSKINDTVDTINKDLVKNMKNVNESILFYGINSGPLPTTEFSVKEEIHRTLMHMNGNGNDIDVVDCVKKDVDGNKVDVKNDYQKNREFTQNTLNGHEREGEYEETVTVPVQRYADSLRRKHFDEEPQTIPTRDTDKEDELIPGSIAYRERKKWLNYVEMPNNPYSPEAIQKRLTAKSTSSLFDMLTKSKDIEEDKDKSKDTVHITESVYKKLDQVPVKEDVNRNRPELTVITEHVHSQGNNREASPSPRILKEVLAEEIPQYKRYGRDYYIKEARASSGGRKKSSFSDTSSLSSMHKSTSLDNFETEFASTGLLIKQFNSIATNQQYTSFTNNEPQQSITITSDSNNTKNILIEYEDVDEQTLFSAKPVYIDDDTDKKFDEILESAYEGAFSRVNIEVEDKEQIIVASPISSNHNDSILSSSSLEDSIKIYNVQTGEIVKCKPDNVSQRYDSKPDRNDNIDITDKNTEENLSDIASIATDEGDDVFVNINESSVEPTLEIIDEFEEIHLPKVKELAKKFVSMDSLNEEDSKPPPQMYSRKKSRENLLNGSDKSTKQMYMHSLTARSITKEFREELKHSMATPLKTPGGTKELPEGIEEVTKEVDRPSSPVPVPGTLKIKLAFFESLKAKLRSK